MIKMVATVFCAFLATGFFVSLLPSVGKFAVNLAGLAVSGTTLLFVVLVCVGFRVFHGGK